jgi:hypothetical protein
MGRMITPDIFVVRVTGRFVVWVTERFVVWVTNRFVVQPYKIWAKPQARSKPEVDYKIERMLTTDLSVW